MICTVEPTTRSIHRRTPGSENEREQEDNYNTGTYVNVCTEETVRESGPLGWRYPSTPLPTAARLRRPKDRWSSEPLTALAARVRRGVDAVADCDGVPSRGLDGVLRLLERFARNNAVDVYQMKAIRRPAARTMDPKREEHEHAPVRMVWKADSTFDASSADVSMNDSPFSAARA